MRDVFISYATEDRDTAEAACAALEATGLRCWIAPRDIHPGSVWGEAIVDGISRCASFVLIFSDAANRSHHIPRELECAVDRNLPIIPFRIDPVLPSKSLSYFIAAAQWLEGQPPPLEQHLDGLVAAVRYQLSPPTTDEKTAQAAPVPPRSLAHDNPALSTRATGQRPAAAAARRGPRRLLAIGIVTSGLVLAAGYLARWSADLGLWTPRAPAPPAACASAYRAGEWTGALARCVDYAATGNAVAQRIVGVLYRRGLGVAPNPTRAVTWLQRAAHHGDEEARAKLWEMYGDSAAAMPSTQPYSASELLELVASGARPPIILSLVNESCLRFSLDSATAEQLLAANATGDLVAGVRSACRASAAGEAPPISAGQLDALVLRHSRAQAESAGETAMLADSDTAPELELDSVLRALFDSAKSAAAALTAPPRLPPPAPASRPRKRAKAPQPVPVQQSPPAGQPPEQKGSGSLLDAAKQGAREAAEEAAKQKAADAMKKVLNFH